MRQKSGPRKGKRIPMNIDGASAVIYGELGFPQPWIGLLGHVSRL
jgi:citrate synthase